MVETTANQPQPQRLFHTGRGLLRLVLSFSFVMLLMMMVMMVVMVYGLSEGNMKNA